MFLLPICAIEKSITRTYCVRMAEWFVAVAPRVSRSMVSRVCGEKADSLSANLFTILGVNQRQNTPGGGQAEEHGERPILDHQAQEDANPLNGLCCVKLADQDEEEGDKGADEEGHLELGEVVPPQLFYEQME